MPGDTPEQRIEFLIRCADRHGIERLILSQGYSTSMHPSREQLREENDRVLRALRRFPDRCNAPELDAIVERAVSLKVPILQHCWFKTGGNEPGESSPADLAELAMRHPDANFICAHTGGNWEVGIRMIRKAKNISC